MQIAPPKTWKMKFTGLNLVQYGENQGHEGVSGRGGLVSSRCVHTAVCTNTDKLRKDARLQSVKLPRLHPCLSARDDALNL